MKQALELKALGLNREISSTRIWAFRIYLLLAIPNAMFAAASSGLAGVAGGVIGVGVVSAGILYVLSRPLENKEQSPVAQTAD